MANLHIIKEMLRAFFFVEMVVNGNTFFNHRILSFCISIYMYDIDWLIVNRSTG